MRSCRTRRFIHLTACSPVPFAAGSIPEVKDRAIPFEASHERTRLYERNSLARSVCTLATNSPYCSSWVTISWSAVRTSGPFRDARALAKNTEPCKTGLLSSSTLAFNSSFDITSSADLSKGFPSWPCKDPTDS